MALKKKNRSLPWIGAEAGTERGSPLLAALKYTVVKKKCHKVARVGVPCAVQAPYRIRKNDNNLLHPYAKAITNLASSKIKKNSKT